jgi:hypothetical protein
MTRTIATLLLAALLAGCASDTATTGPRVSDIAARRYEAAQEKAMAAYTECQTNLGAVVDRLRDLHSRLDIGLSYGEYADQVGDVIAAYDDIPFKRLRDPTCMAHVGLPAEKAVNQHIEARRLWGDCLDRVDCRAASIKPKLRRYWSRSARLTERAGTDLEAMRNP